MHVNGLSHLCRLFLGKAVEPTLLEKILIDPKCVHRLVLDEVNRIYELIGKLETYGVLGFTDLKCALRDRKYELEQQHIQDGKVILKNLHGELYKNTLCIEDLRFFVHRTNPSGFSDCAYIIKWEGQYYRHFDTFVARALVLDSARTICDSSVESFLNEFSWIEVSSEQADQCGKNHYGDAYKNSCINILGLLNAH